MTVMQLKKSLKDNKFNKVYLFYGQEEYLIFSYVDKFKSQLLGDMSDFNYFEFEGVTSINIASEAIEQIPQMSDKKLIILKDSNLIKSYDKSVEKLIREIPDYNAVIFIEREKKNISKKMMKIIEEEGAVIDFSKQKPSDLRAWVNIRLSQDTKYMKNENIEYLIQLCDLSMSKIELELNKLIASVGDKEEITKADIDRMITPVLDYKIYEIVNHVINKNAQTAYEMLKEFKASNEPPTVILSMLFTQLNYFAMVKNMRMQQEPKIDEFFPSNRKFLAKKIAKDINKYSLESLYDALKLCANYDADIKMGRIDGWIAVEIVIANLLRAS